MEFQAGVAVRTADGRDAGKLERVVIDPRQKKVTHLIVSKGGLLSRDRVVPVDAVDTARREEIRLRAEVRDLELMPEYEEVHYVLASEAEWNRDNLAGGDFSAATPPAGHAIPGLYWYPPPFMGDANQNLAINLPRAGAAARGYVTETRRNIPDEDVPLKEGARVLGLDGEHVGNVERVFTDREARATHLLLSKGLLLKSRKVVPMDWVLDVGEAEVRLAVGGELVRGLREYEDPPASAG